MNLDFIILQLSLKYSVKMGAIPLSNNTWRESFI